MVVTDLDGTLLDSRGRLAEADRATLETLGRDGVLRVVATGRSLFSADQVLRPNVPIDFLVFSSGAGILEWKSRRLLQAHNLTAAEASAASAVLLARGLDFMLHAPVPENHRFHYHRATRCNPDFERRVDRYRGHAGAWDGRPAEVGPVGQLLAILPAWDARQFRAIQRALAGLNVIRTTSPLDGRSTWLEIFPQSVSKAAAARWIAERHGRDLRRILVLGNDYNDLDLLEWGGVAFVVANAAAELLDRFPAVSSNERAGFSDAVRRWRSGGRAEEAT